MRKLDVTYTSKLTTADLIKAIKNNDESVLKWLYTDNFRKIEYLVLKNNGSSEQAKDLYQETFLALWKNIKQDKFKPKNQSSINGYLYTIAKHKWMDYLRSTKYKKTLLADSDWQFDASEIEKNALSIDDKIENERLMDKAMNAFKNLGKPCKALLTKFYFEEKSMKDIAQELQLDAASTRNKKYRCMQKLRELALKS